MRETVMAPARQASSTQLARWLREYGWLACACLIGLLLRLPGLSSRPMWYDEAFSVLFSSTGPKSMAYGTLTSVNGVAADVHPLLYYSLLWGWMKIFGTKALAVRMLSVIVGLGIVATGWRLAADLFQRQVADLAAILLAISPFEIHYAQEARMYALLALLCVLCVIFYLRGLEGGQWRYWIGFGICAALAMYAHILAAGVLLTLGIAWFLWGRKRQPLRFLSAVGLAVLLYLPWLLQLPAQIGKVEQAYWIERPGLLEIVQTLMIFITDLPLLDFLLPLGLFAAIMVIAILVWTTFRQGRRVQRDFQRAVWMAFMVFGPVILVFAVSQIRPVFILRGLLPSVTFFLVWLAWGLYTLRNNRVVTGFLALLLLMASAIGIYSRLEYQGFPYAPFEQVAEYLQPRLIPGDVVLHTNKLSMLPMVYVAPEMEQQYMADISGSGSDTLAQPTQEVLGLVAFDRIEDAIDQASTVYLILFERELLDYQALGEDQHPYLTWLEERYSLVEMNQWGELRVYVFHR